MTAPRPDPVLHVTQQWLPASEGFVHDLVRVLPRPGAVVSFAPPVNRQRFPIPHLHTLWATEQLLPRPLARRAVTVHLAALARRHRVRLVHVHHGYRADAVLGLCRRLSLPLVLSLHGHDVTGFVDLHPHHYRAVARHVAAVVVPSRYLAGIAATAGFDPARVHVVPSGIDTAFFTPSPPPGGAPEVLFVGRFVAKKGLDVLAQAWPAVRHAIPGAQLRLLGYGPLEGLARSIPGAEVVLGPDRTEVRDAMRRCSVVVSPSHRSPDDAVETLLLVNVEAQAVGRPVVTTHHGAIPEYVREDETALLVPEHDAPALAAALVRVLEDRSLAGRLSANGPAVAAELDVRRTARRMDDLYESVLASRHAAALRAAS